MMKDLFRKSKKPISLLASLIVLLSSLTPNLTQKIKSVFEGDLNSDVVETADAAESEDKKGLSSLYVDARLLCCGKTEEYSISSLKSILIDGTEYILNSMYSDELFNESSKYFYEFDCPESLIQNLKNEKSEISILDENGTSYPVKNNGEGSDPFGEAVSDLQISESIEKPCLYLSSLTQQLGFINGYWSNADEVNIVGDYHNAVSKIANVINSDNQLPTPEASVQFSGKVYDYYNDAELQGASLIDSNVYDNYYYKFNEALSNYYKVNNYDYYSKYNESYHDTYTDNNSYYSQTYGILNPIYLGSMENPSASAYYNNDTEYGLFGIDNGYNMIDGLKETSVNRIKSIAIPSLLPSGANLDSGIYAAVQGIVENTLSDNGEVLLKTNNPDGQYSNSVLLPLFNEEFLSGKNCLNAKIGEVSDAVFMFNRTTKTSGDKEKVWYSLAQDTRYFYTQDGYRDVTLYKSKTDSKYTDNLMPLNYMYNNQEYKNSGYAVRLELPFTVPDDKNNYTVNVSGNDSVFVYLDGTLILDMGGVNYPGDENNSNVGTIDLSSQKAIVKNVKSLNSIINNVETTFNVKDGQEHVLTFIQIDHNPGDGSLHVETDLPLKSNIPTAKSSYEVKNTFSASGMTNKLSAFVDSLDFKNVVEVDAPHTSGEMDIIPDEKTSLFTDYKGNYKDRVFYEQTQSWSYTNNSDSIEKSVRTVDMGDEQTFASLGLVYNNSGLSADFASQTAKSDKIYLEANGKKIDVTKLFDTSVQHYQSSEQGLYDDSNFLIGSISDEKKQLVAFEGDRIPSISDPGVNFENYAWTNKTVIDNKMKTGSFTITRQVIDNKYNFLMNEKEATYKVYYLNVENVFGTISKDYDTYKDAKCIVDTIKLNPGESLTFNVPVGLRCVIVEENSENSANLKDKNEKQQNYYDFVAADKKENVCKFTDKYTGNLNESVKLVVNVKWVDGSNHLNTRPEMAALMPYELYGADDLKRNDSLTKIMFMGEDKKWHYLTEIFDEQKDPQVYQQFTDLLKYSATQGDTNTVSIENLPKYVLPYMSEKAGNDVLSENAEMQYGLLQKKYGDYKITPVNAAINEAVQTTGESITNTLNGSLTVNTYSGDGTSKKEALDNLEFSLYSSEKYETEGEEPVAKLVSKNGKCSAEDLKAAKYWLVQTKVLEGYEQKSDPIVIEISYDSVDNLNKVVDVFNQRIARNIMVTNEVDLKNEIPGDEKYEDQEFDFSVVLTDVNPEQNYTAEFSTVKNKKSDSTSQKTFTANSDGSLTIDFKLKDDQSMTLKDIPNGASYIITEKATENFMSSYTVTHNSEALVEKTRDAKTDLNEPISTALEVVDLSEKYDDKDVTFAFRNVYSQTQYVLPDSGNSKKLMIIIIAFCGFMFFGTMYLIGASKKRFITR